MDEVRPISCHLPPCSTHRRLCMLSALRASLSGNSVFANSRVYATVGGFCHRRVHVLPEFRLSSTSTSSKTIARYRSIAHLSFHSYVSIVSQYALLSIVQTGQRGHTHDLGVLLPTYGRRNPFYTTLMHSFNLTNLPEKSLQSVPMCWSEPGFGTFSFTVAPVTRTPGLPCTPPSQRGARLERPTTT